MGLQTSDRSVQSSRPRVSVVKNWRSPRIAVRWIGRDVVVFFWGGKTENQLQVDEVDFLFFFWVGWLVCAVGSLTPWVTIQINLGICYQPLNKYSNGTSTICKFKCISHLNVRDIAREGNVANWYWNNGTKHSGCSTWARGRNVLRHLLGDYPGGSAP